MSRYKGRCFRFVDSKNWTYLIFNHYDSYSTTKEINDEIAKHFDLSYSFPEANGALETTFKNGNVLKEIADKYTPTELIKLFPSDDEPRVSPELLRIVMYTNVEPREAKDDGWKGGGRYMLSNLNWNLSETEYSHADKWDIRGPRYVELGTQGYDGRLDIRAGSALGTIKAEIKGKHARGGGISWGPMVDAASHAFAYVDHGYHTVLCGCGWSGDG